MLSISNIGSAGGAASYYGKDDYYVTGEADSPGLTWGGQGAAKAGLSGVSTPEQFRAVLNGSHPSFNGGKMGEASDRHRPGWDLTFSAPKSVSLLALVGGDKRLMEAHRASVAVAMGYVEKHFAITRIREENGSIRHERTGNLVYASTEHQTSRKADPQLHTHNVVANKTYDAKTDTWRALETRELYKHHKTVGLIYRAALADKVLQLGYNVQKDPKDGTFDIADVSQEQREAFSKRHVDIQAKIEAAETEKGRALTPAEREFIVLRDRPSKLEHPRHELEERWRAEAKDVGFDPGSIIAAARERKVGLDVTPKTSGLAKEGLSQLLSRFREMTGFKPKPGDDPYSVTTSWDGRAPARALSYAVRVLEQGSAVFSQHEVLGQALRIAPAGVTHNQVLARAQDLKDDGRLRQADRSVWDGVTTDRAIAVERGIVASIEQGKGIVSPSFTQDVAPSRIAAAERDPAVGIQLNQTQHKSVLRILTSSDRFIGIQGSAGVGKTTMLQVLRAAAKDETFIGLAPTHSAAKQLQEGSGIKSRTLEGFIGSIERAMPREAAMENLRGTYGGATLVVDESSMKSNALAERFIRVMDAVGAKRAVFVGDERQLGSPEAGAPFSHALRSGLDHTVMDEIRRQKDPQLLQAVQHLAKGSVAPAMKILDRYTTALGHNTPEKTFAVAAADAWRTARADGKDPRIIVPTNSLRGAVSGEIRKVLAEEGKLGASQSHDALRPHRMATAEKHVASNFREGQILVFHRNHRESGVASGMHVRVTGRDMRNNILLAQGPNGEQFRLDLTGMGATRHSYFEPFIDKAIEVREGDKLVWDRLSQEKDRATGELTRDFQVGDAFTVERISGDKWTIRTEDGKEHQLDKSDPALKFVSYGYAETADRAQGRTYPDVVAVLGTAHGLAATAARLYVDASRASDTFRLITDDVRSLVMRLQEQDGINLVASRELATVLQSMPELKEADVLARVDPAGTPVMAPAEPDKMGAESDRVDQTADAPSGPHPEQPTAEKLPDKDKEKVLDRPEPDLSL